MDLQAADILRQLDEDGLSDSTIVFFWGDHGRGLPRAKRWLYDSGIHVPLLVRWPGKIEPGSVRDDLVSFIDLSATLLSLAGVAVPAHLQGQAFLGEKRPPPREYIFAARDRMDETYDIIRAVRDKRYKYIRNLQACKPYVQYIHYMEEMPTMQELRRLNKEGSLTGPQKLFFAPEKPEEELYDVTRDPHEVNNLAGSPEHRPALERMRKVLDEWMKETNDLALVPEPELQERMRPGGVWAETAAPVIQPDGGSFRGAVTVRITCPTDGASIAWTTETGPNARWKLYSRELTLTERTTLRAKACRLGYKDSPEVEAVFTITPR
jgi:N-sulfoglucosamine sulfohydrolase